MAKQNELTVENLDGYGVIYDRGEDTVEFQSTYSDDEDEIVIGINGHIIQIKRGATVQLRRSAYLVLKDAAEQRKIEKETINKLRK